jgi:tRNA threonylcarbamoyladenosine biosynthesis protein TsaB
MLVLALDTTTRVSSCAVARDGAVLREASGDPGREHATHLPGDLMAILEQAGLALPQIDAFAVATGPGSFTGLRIGIATMQGLAFAAGKPLIGISAFDALAFHCSSSSISSASSTLFATWSDAWRGEVYAAVYEHGREIEAPIVAHPARLLEGLAGRDVLFAGDGAATYRELIATTLGERARIADPPAPPLAGVIARLAAGAEKQAPHAIRPLYVRRPA